MPGPPGVLLTGKNLIHRVTHYGQVTKLLLESEFQHKRNKQMTKREF